MRLAWVCSRSQGHSARRRAHELVEPGQLARHRLGQLGDPQRREVVGHHVAVEVVPRHRAHRLVREAEALEHDDVGTVVERQLDVGQHVGPGRTGPTSSGPRSPAACVSNRRPSTSRAPSATGSTARRAHARSRNDSAGSTSTVDPRVGDEQLDGALGHHRRAGHGVEHLAVLDGAGHHRLDDGRVDVLEGLGRSRTGGRSRRRRARRPRPGGGGCAGSGAGWPRGRRGCRR